ncbi:glycosyltransferase [Naasia sp. SYSU D00948]|uniref:glycosyltransferase n=1 Tax=Naasia sp. SYSU D00948 TaxID=2817379 RepID=UPI001B308876|nr:glycosyltransferase [Naasia sp. SYSU D00948]
MVLTTPADAAATATPAPRPLSVMVVVISLHGGGAEFVGRTWMEWLVSQGHSVTAVTTSSKDTDRYLPAGVAAVSLGGVRGHAAKARALKRLFEERRPDAAVGLQAYANLVLVAAAELMPKSSRPAVVVSERNLVAYGLPGSPLSHRVKHLLTRRAYRRADHVIAISHPIAGELAGGFGIPEGRCTVVPNPAAAKVPGRSVRRSADDIDIEVIIAHRLVPQKRPALAVRTAAELARRGHRVRLTVFGTGPLLDELVTLAGELQVDLNHRGWVEDWFAECSDKAVFLLASHREGFGNVLVEAAAAGVPSVALSGALGVADALVPGITGELAIDDSPARVADALERAAGISIPDISAWLDHFSSRSSGTTLEHVLRKAIAT